ncbi:MAG: glycogen debranching enzyme N-terminal domain-containing protein [Anaerolineales bacterium]|nr:glycogen debranching enzyme N-terminal domain-containing protein [Anaerolineales bacterium]
MENPLANSCSHPTFDFGREVCSHLAVAEEREWLVTNGIGGYASGTIAGVLTRRYHGLLVAALKPPLGRTLLLTKLDETVACNGDSYPLYANRWDSGAVDPTGFYSLERFHLEGTIPVWTFGLAEGLLEKRVWMQLGANTTYICYSHRRGDRPLVLTLKVMVNYRDYHGSTHAGGWQMQITPVEHGLQVNAFDGATSLYLLSDQAEARPEHTWYRNFYLSVEAYRGLDTTEDHLYAGFFRAILRPGESLTLVASTDPAPNLDGLSAYAERQAYEQRLVTTSGAGFKSALLTPTPEPDLSNLTQHLILAADQFIVRRPSANDPDGHSIIAGYPWFGDWGRDTMISLSGLTLSTGRPEAARSILRTFAQFVDQGMLPNRFPDAGETPEYNTVDATLWYFEAIRAYYAATADDELLAELWPILQDIIAWHQCGTRYNIHVDPTDGLLYAGEPGVQLTWMDAKVGDWVITPRIGKPVEVNALWYNALRIMADIARRLGQPADAYDASAGQVQTGFARFWNETAGYCYDVLDGPNGHETTLRPNQILAVSLPYSPLEARQQRALVDVCARYLLTSHGLRSLAASDPAYAGHYGGSPRQRDSVYHQGTVWAWLMGPFVSAHLRVYRDPTLARSYLLPLLRSLASNTVGSISEIFDGDAPFLGRGCTAQAWSVAEVLRAWLEVNSVDRG